MYQLLNLGKTGDLVERGVVEGGGDRGGMETFDGSGDVGERCVDFVANEDRESAEMSVIFRFDAYLDVLVFV